MLVHVCDTCCRNLPPVNGLPHSAVLFVTAGSEELATNVMRELAVKLVFLSS